MKMFKRSLLFFLLLNTIGSTVEPIQLALQERDYKKAIVILKETLCQAEAAERGVLNYDLAMLYLKDQDQENAFHAFLEAIAETKTASINNPYDAEAYKKALETYLDPASPSPQVTAQKLIMQIEPILKLHPQQHLLDYFIAIAYANLGRYEDFFKSFYTAYKDYPDHYLAYKTKAVLHIKLLERKRDETDRMAQREAITNNLNLALKREPHDVAIYKMLIGFSPKENKAETIRQSLNKIVDDNIIIPRGDIIFYVQEALDINEMDLVQRFIGRANEWYPHSRIVAASQHLLNDKKTQRE